jgi:hypothetical protein
MKKQKRARFYQELSHLLEKYNVTLVSEHGDSDILCCFKDRIDAFDYRLSPGIAISEYKRLKGMK